MSLSSGRLKEKFLYFLKEFTSNLHAASISVPLDLTEERGKRFYNFVQSRNPTFILDIINTHHDAHDVIRSGLSLLLITMNILIGSYDEDTTDDDGQHNHKKIRRHNHNDVSSWARQTVQSLADSSTISILINATEYTHGESSIELLFSLIRLMVTTSKTTALSMLNAPYNPLKESRRRIAQEQFERDLKAGKVSAKAMPTIPESPGSVVMMIILTNKHRNHDCIVGSLSKVILSVLNSIDDINLREEVGEYIAFTSDETKLTSFRNGSTNGHNNNDISNSNYHDTSDHRSITSHNTYNSFNSYRSKSASVNDNHHHYDKQHVVSEQVLYEGVPISKQTKKLADELFGPQTYFDPLEQHKRMLAGKKHDNGKKSQIKDWLGFNLLLKFIARYAHYMIDEPSASVSVSNSLNGNRSPFTEAEFGFPTTTTGAIESISVQKSSPLTHSIRLALMAFCELIGSSTEVARKASSHTRLEILFENLINYFADVEVTNAVNKALEALTNIKRIAAIEGGSYSRRSSVLHNSNSNLSISSSPPTASNIGLLPAPSSTTSPTNIKDYDDDNKDNTKEIDIADIQNKNLTLNEYNFNQMGEFDQSPNKSKALKRQAQKDEEQKLSKGLQKIMNTMDIEGRDSSKNSKSNRFDNRPKTTSGLDSDINSMSIDSLGSGSISNSLVSEQSRGKSASTGSGLGGRSRHNRSAGGKRASTSHDTRRSRKAYNLPEFPPRRGLSPQHRSIEPDKSLQNAFFSSLPTTPMYPDMIENDVILEQPERVKDVLAQSIKMNRKRQVNVMKKVVHDGYPLPDGRNSIPILERVRRKYDPSGRPATADSLDPSFSVMKPVTNKPKTPKKLIKSASTPPTRSIKGDTTALPEVSQSLDAPRIIINGSSSGGNGNGMNERPSSPYKDVATSVVADAVGKSWTKLSPSPLRRHDTDMLPMININQGQGLGLPMININQGQASATMTSGSGVGVSHIMEETLEYNVPIDATSHTNAPVSEGSASASAAAARQVVTMSIEQSMQGLKMDGMSMDEFPMLSQQYDNMMTGAGEAIQQNGEDDSDYDSHAHHQAASKKNVVAGQLFNDQSMSMVMQSLDLLFPES